MITAQINAGQAKNIKSSTVHRNTMMEQASETASVGKKLWKEREPEGERDGTVFKTLAAMAAASLVLNLPLNL